MTDWTRPEALTTEELVGFLLNEHEMHAVGFCYSDGVGVVGGVYKEAARRLARSEAALKPVMEFNPSGLWASAETMLYKAFESVQESHRIYNGGER